MDSDAHNSRSFNVMRHVLLVTTVVLGLVCQAQRSVAQPLTFCQQPNTVTFLLNGLHKTAGMASATLESISTTFTSPDGNAFSCHATIVTSGGERILGTITSSQDASGQLHSDWVKDAGPTPQLPTTHVASVSDARCNAPPYGGTVAGYKAFIKDFGSLFDNPTKMLAGICNVKFGHADRTAMYNLGFTNDEIDTKDTADLAAQMVMALKNLVDKVPQK